ncbi:type II toxin-antitoxin system RelE/ParE family toxin [Rhizobium sp. DKSPLA3]|uniref:Type II toxin-antitoxin system RelE/ParE family toxin n=1 Tax=Rhizobium quercicola TaxID=2901226 RepID=A0A9X1NX30_9HYPH|nr:type II toxin-antitoxin system RelE/ParE family toxin [Rhizobium quercicola]MCD7110886.1 type II toxin-antitoxin system RelE/ParE family toxin [Rhizobium quercicola]
MTSPYRILYLPEAVQELIDINDMIAAYAGVEIAGRKLADIEAVTKTLADMPYKAPIRDGLPSGLRTIPAGQKGVICFTVDEEARTVQIVAISYAGSDWMSKARDRL